ncbi:hypothetical protein Droror1_Dr00027631 [Drosera rotundifolia]
MQLPLVWQKLSRRLEKKDVFWARKGQHEAALKKARVRSKIAEAEAKAAKETLNKAAAKTNSVKEVAIVLQDRLRTALDQLATQKTAYDDAQLKGNSRITELQEELAKTIVDYKTLYWRNAES